MARVNEEIIVREMHGLSREGGKRTRLHFLWLKILQKCRNPKDPNYRYYGGRGISVCSRWDSYKNFHDDVGPHPGAGMTLDRIDNDGDYEPGNVRWATRQTQARNRGYCKVDEAKAFEIRTAYAAGGVTQEMLAEHYGVSQATISQITRGVTWR